MRKKKIALKYQGHFSFLKQHTCQIVNWKKIIAWKLFIKHERSPTVAENIYYNT